MYIGTYQPPFFLNLRIKKLMNMKLVRPFFFGGGGVIRNWNETMEINSEIKAIGTGVKYASISRMPPKKWLLREQV